MKIRLALVCILASGCAGSFRDVSLLETRLRLPHDCRSPEGTEASCLSIVRDDNLPLRGVWRFSMVFWRAGEDDSPVVETCFLSAARPTCAVRIPPMAVHAYSIWVERIGTARKFPARLALWYRDRTRLLHPTCYDPDYGYTYLGSSDRPQPLP